MPLTTAQLRERHERHMANVTSLGCFAPAPSRVYYLASLRAADDLGVVLNALCCHNVAQPSPGLLWRESKARQELYRRWKLTRPCDAADPYEATEALEQRITAFCVAENEKDSAGRGLQRKAL